MLKVRYASDSETQLHNNQENQGLQDQARKGRLKIEWFDIFSRVAERKTLTTKIIKKSGQKKN
uniref:SFRICE_017341 n=1 Tax=Spodoptera frugiperda TaxID=7108 RepID=A0A2H1WBE0_SPOFR